MSFIVFFQNYAIFIDMGVIQWILFLTFPLMAELDVHVDTEHTSIQKNKPSSRVMWHMPRHRRYVTLTFDDGPDDIVTPQLLDILNQKNVRATFFLVGHMIAKFPHVVHRIISDGHEIANHTWAHYRLDEMTQDQVSLQLSSTTDALSQLQVPMAPYVRPPGGRFNNFVVHSSRAQRLTL